MVPPLGLEDEYTKRSPLLLVGEVGPSLDAWEAEHRWISVPAWQSTFEQEVIYTTIPGSSAHYEQTLFLLCHSIFPLHIS